MSPNQILDEHLENFKNENLLEGEKIEDIIDKLYILVDFKIDKWQNETE